MHQDEKLWKLWDTLQSQGHQNSLSGALQVSQNRLKIDPGTPCGTQERSRSVSGTSWDVPGMNWEHPESLRSVPSGREVSAAKDAKVGHATIQGNQGTVSAAARERIRSGAGLPLLPCCFLCFLSSSGEHQGAGYGQFHLSICV